MPGSSDSNLPPQNQADEHWLGIEAACKYLGVDQSTLRRWSDSGRVPVFRTPGGHRRYREADLQAVLTGRKPDRGVSRRTLTRMSISAYEPDYLRKARDRRWYRAYSDDQLHELRTLGRRLIDFAVRSISDPDPDELGEIFEEGRRIGRRYGSISADAGLSATDTVEAFLFFRYPVFQSVTTFFEEEKMPASQAIRGFTDICQFMDEVLVSTMNAHAEASR
ncbi:MAG: helix-turn-helix domain-containing protein [Sphaerobacteraceae bacterium]|nr:MAG: helix-turn-helix domain-containing protein [Sphaerobacteraceae bacterium]